MDEKKRVPNFLIQEKNLLTNLVFAHRHIIEYNKNRRSQTWKEKDRAWEKITAQFNARSPQDLPRTTKSLRKLYDNMKKQLRKEIAEEKTGVKKTRDELPISNSKSDLNDESKNKLLQLFSENPSIDIEQDSIVEPELEVSGHNDITLETDQPSTSKEDVKVFAKTPKLAPKKCNDVSAPSFKRPSTEVLKHNGTKNRPKIQLPAPNLIKEYSSLAKVKLDYYQAEKENLIKKRKQEEILFNLKRDNMELEIKIKEFELDNLKQNT